MEAHSKGNPEQDRTQAAAQVESAHQILKTLQEKIGKHPELGAAITKLEMALNILAVKTGGML
jgi:phosphoglycerate-specific signal transduction histidine kinase